MPPSAGGVTFYCLFYKNGIANEKEHKCHYNEGSSYDCKLNWNTSWNEGKFLLLNRVLVFFIVISHASDRMLVVAAAVPSHMMVAGGSSSSCSWILFSWSSLKCPQSLCCRHKADRTALADVGRHSCCKGGSPGLHSGN